MLPQACRSAWKNIILQNCGISKFASILQPMHGKTYNMIDTYCKLLQGCKSAWTWKSKCLYMYV